MEEWKKERRNILGELREGMQTLTEILNHKRGILDRLKGRTYSMREVFCGFPSTTSFYIEEKYRKNKGQTDLRVEEPIHGFRIMMVYANQNSLNVTKTAKKFLIEFSRKYGIESTISYTSILPGSENSFIVNREVLNLA